METKSTGKNYFPNFMAENKNSAFDSNSLKSFNKSNYNEAGLTEMMVLQKYEGELVRQQYVEEPSRRGSFLEEIDNRVVE
jgi:hypothetical protein